MVVRCVRVAVLAAILAAAVGLAAGPAGAATSLRVRVSENAIDLGRSTVLLGSVSPVGATPVVVVQRRVGGRWGDRQSGKVAADGTFSIRIRPSQAGIYALRVRSAGGAVVSGVVYLRVRLSAAQAIRATDFTRFSFPIAAACGAESADEVILFDVGPADVSYGDLSGDGVEEAAVVIGCGIIGGSISWSRVLIYEWRQGGPKLVLSWIPVTAPASDWAPTILSATISKEVLTVKGTVVPPGGCHACSTEPWSSRLVLDHGQLVLA